MAAAWHSYDSVASSHDRLAVPNLFAAPARDLVALVEAASARSLLDVGSGTGIAASQAAKIMEPGSVVVALDPSLGMLRKAWANGLARVVAGKVPGLPFADATFDRVIASFVLNHLKSYEAAVADMARTVRPDGKLGVTVWGPLNSDPRQSWRDLAESFVGREALADALHQALPWEDWFFDPANLREALHDAGLKKISIQARQYANRIPIADFLSLRQSASAGRFLQAALNADRWRRFQQTADEIFHRRFADPLDEIRNVHIATGER